MVGTGWARARDMGIEGCASMSEVGGWRHSRAVRRRAEISVRGGERRAAKGKARAIARGRWTRARVDACETGGGAVIYWKSARDA